MIGHLCHLAVDGQTTGDGQPLAAHLENTHPEIGNNVMHFESGEVESKTQGESSYSNQQVCAVQPYLLVTLLCVFVRLTVDNWF